MCEMLDRLMKKSEAKVRAESAIGMLKDKMPLHLIAKYTQLFLEQLQELAKSIGVAVVM